MSKQSKIRSILLASALAILAGCAQSGSQIGSSLTLCCPGSYEDYADYRLETENMPLFLRDYVVEQLQLALAEVGLVRNDTLHDLRVVLRYNHINLDAQQQDIDPFVRIESINVDLHYIAQLELEMYETATDELVWAGAISRIHQVAPGEYMHEERAQPEFLMAFRRLLQDYPASD